MEPLFSSSNCIPLDPADERQAGRCAPLIEAIPVDPREERFAPLGIRTETGGVLLQPENGKLILNDGDDATTDVWQRLSLFARKPVRALDVEPVVSCLH